VNPSFVAFVVVGVLLAGGSAIGQQEETGPKATKDGHPMRTPETGTRGPSGGSPETGYHGPRDVTRDAEPGKAKTSEEQRRSGQTNDPSRKSN
jgi:hypothetical protein